MGIILPTSEIRQPFVSPVGREQVVKREIGVRAKQIACQMQSASVLGIRSMEIVPALGMKKWLEFISKLAKNPKRGIRLFTACQHTAQIRAGATTHKALELMYTWPQFKQGFEGTNHRPPGEFVEFNQARFWEENVLNALAIRNRLRLVKCLLYQAIKDTGKGQIHILSLAAGSARAVIEVMAEIGKGYDVYGYFLDTNPEAIEYSCKLAHSFGVVKKCQWVKGTIKNFPKKFPNLQPDIVEMVGFLDYPGDDSAVNLLRMIYNFMPAHSIFLTANVRPNQERDFIEKVVNWAGMKYRTPQDLAKLLVTAGFGYQDPQKVQLYLEPLVHTIAYCSK